MTDEKERKKQAPGTFTKGGRFVPQPYVDGDIEYVLTITAVGGRFEDFMRLIGEEPKRIDSGILLKSNNGIVNCDSTKIYFISNDPVLLDVYRSRTARTSKKPFRENTGGMILALVQTGYNLKEIEITHEEEITEFPKVKNRLENKLEF